MVLQHFGLKHYPLGKAHTQLWDDGFLARLDERFHGLLESPGVGLLTGAAGVGKTAALRQLTRALNPHRYQVVYLAETDFGRLDLYRSLALALGLEPAYRRAALWRDIKARIQELADGKAILPIWIIDEAQNLPVEFFRDLPAFLNFAFDSRDPSCDRPRPNWPRGSTSLDSARSPQSSPTTTADSHSAPASPAAADVRPATELGRPGSGSRPRA